jgi:hypothetical protein
MQSDGSPKVFRRNESGISLGLWRSELSRAKADSMTPKEAIAGRYLPVNAWTWKAYGIVQLASLSSTPSLN